MDAPTLASHSGLEVDEALVQSPEHMQAQTTSIDLDGQLHPPLLLRQDLQSGCGGQLWPAGLVLARYLLRHPEIVLQDRVVELGCGGGLVGYERLAWLTL